MRIAIFTDTFYPDVNGVAKTLKRLTSFLESQKISYKIFAPSSPAKDFTDYPIHRTKSLSFFLYPECRLALPNLLQMKSEIQSFSPDLIHVATPFNIGLCGVYFSKKMNIPLVCSYHTNFDEYLQYYNLPFLTRLLWNYMHWFHKTCKKIFVPSPATLQLLKQQGFTNLELWPRGVDCKLFHPNHHKNSFKSDYKLEDSYLLTYVGRLAPEKDLHTLLAVAKTLPPDLNKKIHWLIIGDGPLRKELEAKAPANMTFTGYLSGKRLAQAYASSDILVFPSPTETFGNVVLESLACGTPVIGAKSGGVQNIIEPGVTGLLCSPGNVQEFTHSILHLLTNHPLRKQMGNAGRHYALTQSWEQILNNLIYQYSDIIQKRDVQKYA
ncbi:glycosyltransferase family 4 protein [Neobacillus cucumis]|uniref:glycosyltransferase family 4 protein n=1 Tax=Neobacillus cucumis TaxID=1740721 RepID=UPI001962DF39|nr:glycosyltransferase family 1 protein [Neobacillus cucumis]MBM7654361.1 glycosyltransferase involved in cell wall biosynthesis [Neobacillus cucumis]